MIGQEEYGETSAGVPQGSVLGPILWNVLYDGVLALEVTADAMCVGYADDLALGSGGGRQGRPYANR